MKFKNKKYYQAKNKVILIFLLVLVIILLVSYTREKLERLFTTRQTFIPLSTVTNEIDKNNPHLKFFYEPKANQNEESTEAWVDKKVTYTINSDTLNERYDYQIEKASDTFRIITLGDSFTFGHFVNTAQNYSEVLEDLLNKNLTCQKIKHFEVINLGVRGYDIEYPVERFLKRGVKYQPDLVIWLIHWWNFAKINEWLPPIREELKLTGIPEFNKEKGFYELESRAMDELSKRYSQNQLLDYQGKAMQKLADNYSGKLILLSYPGEIKDKNKILVNDFIKKNSKYVFYDGISDLFAHPEWRSTSGHPNALGHQILANEILGYFRKNIFSNCQYHTQ